MLRMVVSPNPVALCRKKCRSGSGALLPFGAFARPARPQVRMIVAIRTFSATFARGWISPCECRYQDTAYRCDCPLSCSHRFNLTCTPSRLFDGRLYDIL